LNAPPVASINLSARQFVTDTLVDDVQRATYRTARIAGLSTAGDTLALLWKRDARGAATALSLFEVDRAAL
jgi:hypothetical protein